MALTNKEREEMRLATEEAAHALLEDMRFVRGYLTADKPTNGDVRRTSAALRRFLLDGQLTAVAAPRIGRLRIPIPDNIDLMKTAGDNEVLSAGVAPIFGWQSQMFDSWRVTFDPLNTNLQLPGGSYPHRIVKVDTLLSDQVVRFKGTPITRADFLRFICYHAFGVHYTGREEAVFDLIRQLRYAMSMGVHEGTFALISQDLGSGKPSRMLMDFAHAHAFSTGYYLVTAPDIFELEALIEAEIAGAEPTA